MKPNYICCAGITVQFICGYLWKSNIMIIASLLGYIFHLNPDNKIFKYTDLSVNILLSSKAMILEKKTIIPATFSAFCYIHNNVLYRPESIMGVIYNLKHVVFIQFVGVYGYYLLYKHEPCLDLYFVCD